MKEGSALILKFPENREFNREFSGFSAESDLPGVNSRSHFNGLQVNSLIFAKVGRFGSKVNALQANSLSWAEQGIFSTEQGIYPSEQGIRFP